MIVPLIIFGVIAIMAGINGKLTELGAQLKKDFQGTPGSIGFVEWFAAVIVVAILSKAVGISQGGKYLIALILLAYILKNEQVVSQFFSQTQALKATPASGGSAATPGSGGNAATPGSGGSSATPNIGGIAASATKMFGGGNLQDLNLMGTTNVLKGGL
jgi:hypothetical protein